MVGFGALHDPDGLLLEMAQQLLPEISKHLEGLVIAVSPQSKPDYLKLNKPGKIDFFISGEIDDFAFRRKTALEKALKLYPDGVFWTVDLDKLLHWYTSEREEMISHTRSVPEGLVVMGRTPRAWDTYPVSWRNTEGIVNLLANKVFKKENWDFFTGQMAMDAKTAGMILSGTTVSDVSQVLEWVHLAFLSSKVSYRTFEGLSWEDPDRFEAEIEKLGFVPWQTRFYDGMSEWQKRINFLKVGVDYLNKLASDAHI